MNTKTDKTAPTSNADGSVDIPLRRPIDIDGVKVHSLRMREPLVQDQIASQAADGSPAEQEVALVANLCMIDPAAIRKMPLRDYANIKTVLLGFLD